MITARDKKLLERYQQLCRTIKEATAVTIAENETDKLKRIERAKKDYNFFVQYYFPHYVTDKKTGKQTDCADFHLKAAKEVLNNPNVFAVLEWAREHAKSVHADIMLPMWLKIHGEMEGMVLVGKNETDACRLLGDIQAEFEENQRYIHDFGGQKSLGSWEDGEFKTKDDISFIAIGRGQSPRGIRNRARRPNYCIIDDIDDDDIVLNGKRVRKVVKWILGGLFGALSIKQARLIVAGNRIHRYSILAHIVGDINGQPKRQGIYHSKVNALDKNGRPSWHQKYTLKELQDKMELMGYAISQTEYFNNPIIEGTIFKDEWIQWKKMLPLHQYNALVMYGDPSFKSSATSDFKAIKLWGKKGNELHLIKAFVRQCSVKTMVQWWYDFHESLPENVIVEYYIEANFIQDDLLEDFVTEGNIRGYQLPIRGDYRQKPDKFSRIIAMQPLYERGFIFYNIDEKENPDMQRAKEQLLAIEQGSSTADDSPDADEGGIYKLQRSMPVSEAGHRTGRREKIKNVY